MTTTMTTATATTTPPSHSRVRSASTRTSDVNEGFFRTRSTAPSAARTSERTPNPSVRGDMFSVRAAVPTRASASAPRARGGRAQARAVAMTTTRSNLNGASFALGGARRAYGGASSGALRVDARHVTLGASRGRKFVVKAMFEVRGRANAARVVDKNVMRRVTANSDATDDTVNA